MRKWLLIATLLLSGNAFAEPITGVEGFSYKVYRKSSPPKNLAELKIGSNSNLSCDALGFMTDYGAVWDNVKNVVDNIIANKKVLLLGAAQYLLAKTSPTLYSVLSKLNSYAELALKYNFDACALYKKAQQEADKASSSEGLTGLCMSMIGDPDVCSAPGRALKAVFGKGQVDVVDEVIKNKDVADLVKAVAGTIVLTASGDGMETDFYAPAWHIADLYSGFYFAYYRKYAEIAEKVHNGELNADQYVKEYGPWITVGGEVKLDKVKIRKTASGIWIDLSEAKFGGYQIPYEFFYEVSQFTPEVATIYVRQLAQYAAMIDLQSFLAAVEKALSANAGKTGKAGILKQQALIQTVEQSYRQFARTFGTAGKENILALQESARRRYATLLKNSATSPPPSGRSYIENLMLGPEKPKVLIRPK